MHKPHDGKRFREGKPAADRINDLDDQILRLLKRRTSLLAEIKRASDHKIYGEIEKSMRGRWEAAGSAGFNAKLLRRLFDLLQDLEPALHIRGAEDRPFMLTPRREPVDVDMPAPDSVPDVRLTLMSAARCGKEFHISDLLITDPLVEFIKALNQAGGGMYWESGAISGRGTGAPEYDGKTIYAGNDPLNLYLLLFDAVFTPGRIRFIGGPGLKLLNLTPLMRFFPTLGSRLQPAVPKTVTVPLKLESSAVLPDEVYVPDELSDEIVVALIVSAAGRDRDIRISWGDFRMDNGLRFLLASALRSLDAFGVDYEVQDTEITLNSGELELPETFSFPMDPYLAAWFLMLPYFIHGRVRLTGTMPDRSGEYSRLVKFLRSIGLEIEQREDEVISSFSASNIRSALLDAGPVPECLPLAVAAAMHAAVEEGNSRLVPVQTEDDFRFISRLAESLGVEARHDDVQVTFTVNEGTQEYGPIYCPDAHSTMAAALNGFTRPGLQLADPGAVTELLPRLWNFYNRLPAPPGDVFTAPAKKEVSDDAPSTTRRRIRI